MSTDTWPPLLISRDPDLIDQVLRIAASRRVAVLAVRPQVLETHDSFRHAPLIICGTDMLADLLRAQPEPHPHLVIVTTQPADPTPWDLVSKLTSAVLAVLPQANGWLGDQLAACGKAAT